MIKLFEEYRKRWQKGDILVCIKSSINYDIYRLRKYQVVNVSPREKVEVRSLEGSDKGEIKKEADKDWSLSAIRLGLISRHLFVALSASLISIPYFSANSSRCLAYYLIDNVVFPDFCLYLQPYLHALLSILY